MTGSSSASYINTLKNKQVNIKRNKISMHLAGTLKSSYYMAIGA